MLYLVIVAGSVIHAGEDRQEAMDIGKEEIKGHREGKFLLVSVRDTSHEEVGSAQPEQAPALKKGGRR